MQAGRIVGLDAPGIVLSPYRNTMRFRYPLLCALAALLLAPAAGAQTIVINEILYDPPSNTTGDANQDGTADFSEDEFIEIVNTTNTAIDISGFTLSDDDGGDFAFPAGTSLGPNQAAILFGGGAPAGTFGGALVFTDDGSIGSGLSNSGDLIQLKDASGTLVTEVGYGSAGSAGTADDQSLARSPNLTGAFVAHSTIASNPVLFSPGRSNTVAGPASEELTTILLGANEVPPVTTGAAGGVRAILTGTELIVTGRFGGLESDYNAAIGSHLHGAAAGENGPVRYALNPTLDADNRGGTFEAAKNVIAVRATFADSLRNGLVYVNIHTVATPTGEIRGQLRTQAPAPTVTLNQARIVGPGFSVSLSGTVSRAKGDFAYVQDDTGALTIRQTSGAFADEVEAGTIAAGTALTVTGELSEFNGQLQISNTALASYTVGATGAPPTPEIVTLAQLAADGEAYESRLISVVDVTFADAGGTFAAGKDYQISQGTDTGTVRVNAADETAVVGVTIPAVGQLSGVVDERNGTYRILPIRATDVTVGGTDGESGPEGALSLDIVNPVRGSATVRFELAEAGRATVALFDALGRRVAVLADGPVAAGAQTATLEAGRLATGVYVLRLQTEDAAISRTLTVVR